MRSPLFVLETKKMSSVQQTLRDAKQSIAIVIDEYSGVAGLLTVEDIAQEIFGTMYDEFDTHNYSGLRKISKNEFIANGDLRLIDINESLSLQLDSKFYETIGGFIFEKLDKIPEIGESIFEQDTKFIVEDVTDRKILKVKILTGGTH
jgi:CBS domain containing-hemolysin-like protein